MNALRLNGTKMMYHPHTLRDWLEGRPVYPLQIEISPTNACNHNCVFCAYEYLSRRPVRFLDMDLLRPVLQELVELGCKSIFYSGEGEPLLHQNLEDMVEYAGELGFSQAVNSNGVLFRDKRMERIFPYLEWIRISFNGTTPDEYSRIHNTSSKDFSTVLSNIESMAALKQKQNLATVIGVQLVYIGQSMDTIYSHVSKIKDVGADYFSVKCFNQHPYIAKRELEISHNICEQLLSLNTDTFKVAIRSNMEQKPSPRTYTCCYGMELFAEITSNGDVYSCGPHLGDRAFCYGNIGDGPFKQLWSKENRQRVSHYIQTHGPLDKLCMPNCRLHALNDFLWTMRHPPQHINFL